MRRLYLALAAAGAFLLLPLGLALSTCSAPPPVKVTNPLPLNPSPAAQSTAQATATASQTVRVTITRKPASQDAPQATKQGGPRGLSLNGTDGGSTAPTDGESITIEVSQAVGVAAGASASVIPSNSMELGNRLQNVDGSHARLGVIAATMPGVLALDYQLARIDVPTWLLGVPLELGLDVAGNLETGAVGATVGGKGFAGVWAWSRWNLAAQGVSIGLGLRF